MNRNRPATFFVTLAATIAVLLPATGSGQNYPTRPVRIVTAEAGGGLDFMARMTAQGLTASLGQQVIVENRPSGTITGEMVARASPDGHTLLLNGASFWLFPFLQEKVPYNPVRDFAPITLATNQPLVLVVHPSVPAKSVKELVALAKSRPGELNYASSSAATPPHLAAELFKNMTGVNIVRITYRGAGPAVNAVASSEVQLMFPNTASAAPHIKANRLRPLAVTSAEPTAQAPGLPTMAASGLPGYEASSVWGFLAPAKTPEATIGRLHQEIVRLLNRPEFKERLFNAGVDIIGTTPVQFAAFIKTDMARNGKLIREAGIRAD